MRSMSALLSGWPGAIASASSAASRWASRSPALREALSGPWQAKQFSARIGRMSRLYSIFVWANAGCAAITINIVALEYMRFIGASSLRIVIEPARLLAVGEIIWSAQSQRELRPAMGLAIARRRRRHLRQIGRAHV